MFECVINVSEGVDTALLDRLANAAGGTCVDVHSDRDHHRSVFTLADENIDVVARTARALTESALGGLDVRRHSGVHPRFGVVDVVPFVSLSGDPADDVLTGDAARSYAQWVSAGFNVPVFLYDAADPQRRSLPDTRRHAFVDRRADLGPDQPHPIFGAVAVGARPPMIAVNVELASDDEERARAIASGIRAANGGLPGVRALAFPLASRATVQVSMNLVDLPATGMEAAVQAVAGAAHAVGLEVARIEVVGLVPRSEFDRWTPGFRAETGLDETITVEARVARRRLSAGSGPGAGTGESDGRAGAGS